MVANKGNEKAIMNGIYRIEIVLPITLTLNAY
jgi:hypothetical protein